jgi:hypothetical protein
MIDISLVNLANILKCFLIRLVLLVGQTSVLDTADIKLFRSLCSSSHCNSKWSTVCSVVPHGHIGDSITLKRCGASIILRCRAP